MGKTLSISAGELHKILLQTHAIGNLARKRFADALRALSEQKLYRKLGFYTVMVRRGYYENDREDALVMVRALSESGRIPPVSA